MYIIFIKSSTLPSIQDNCLLSDFSTHCLIPYPAPSTFISHQEDSNSRSCWYP